MSTKFHESLIVVTKQRAALALFSLVCLIVFAFIPTSGQMKTQRRVTSLQLGNAVEGSRVTLVADSSLSDYEAFRRGDRFYVRIPLAEFTSAPPHYRANGFDDVQIQRVGDSLIVSFKLQPGATARADLRGNRLDVIFSSPNRSSSATTPITSRVDDPQSYGTRDRDAAGPVPTAASSRERVVSETTTGGSDRGVQDPWAINPIGNSGRRGKSANAKAVPSPLLTPTPSLTPGSSSTYPAVSAASSPIPSSASTTSRSGSSQSLRQRSSAMVNWISANRLASLIGALILLGLILLFVMFLRNRRAGAAKAKRAKVPKVQPSYSQVNELSDASSSSDEPVRAPQNEPAARVASVLSETAPGRNAAPKKQETQTASAANARSPWVSKPAMAANAAGSVEYSSDEEEREVFEL